MLINQLAHCSICNHAIVFVSQEYGWAHVGHRPEHEAIPIKLSEPAEKTKPAVGIITELVESLEHCLNIFNALQDEYFYYNYYGQGETASREMIARAINLAKTETGQMETKTAVEILSKLALAAEWHLDTWLYQDRGERGGICPICEKQKTDGHDPECLYTLARAAGLLQQEAG